jgi:hypothetical protein
LDPGLIQEVEICGLRSCAGDAAEKFGPQARHFSLHVHELEKTTSAMVDDFLKDDGRESKMEQPEAGGCSKYRPVTQT